MCLAISNNLLHMRQDAPKRIFSTNSRSSVQPKKHAKTLFFFSTLHPLSTVIFATAAVLAFVLLRDSRFNFHYYTQREATPTQKSEIGPEVRCDLSRLLAQKITKRMNSLQQTSFAESPHSHCPAQLYSNYITSTIISVKLQVRSHSQTTLANPIINQQSVSQSVLWQLEPTFFFVALLWIMQQLNTNITRLSLTCDDCPYAGHRPQVVSTHHHDPCSIGLLLLSHTKSRLPLVLRSLNQWFGLQINTTRPSA